MKKNSGVVYWGMKDSEGDSGKHYGSNVDFSKINNRIVGKRDNKVITFKTHMSRIGFPEQLHSAENVYEFMNATYKRERRQNNLLKKDGRFDKKFLKKRCDSNDATGKAIELIVDNVIAWN